MSKIKFGTDGWRAIIAKDYTFDNVARVAQATAQWLTNTYGEAPRVLMGYDTRFQGRAFAEHAAAVMASAGVHVRLSDDFATTPAVSWGTLHYGCNAGIVITASHNPPAYNGFKIKADFGGPATPDQIAAVEAELDRLGELQPQSFDALRAQGRIELVELQQQYTDLLGERLDIDAITASGLKVAHDAMYGAGQGVVQALLGAENVVALHHDRNPGFHGQAPEPIDKNLGELSQAVVEHGCAVGLANDGDADRIGMFDEQGNFVDSHRLLALLVKYLHEEKGLSGEIVKTFSTTEMLDRQGEQYGLPVHTTKIGFKYIGQRFVDGDVLVGGEESGGMAVKGHIPERDGIYIGLLVVEMMVKRGKTLSALVDELLEQFGPHYAARNDLHTTNERKVAFLERLDTDPFGEVNGHAVSQVDTKDGYKFRTEAGWLLFRPSGTEPVLRIYAESTSPEAADALVAWGVAQVTG